jgi:hypothetical protein
MDEYDYDAIDLEAKNLAKRFPKFWDDVCKWDNSAYYHDPPRDAWDTFSKNKHYESIYDVICRYRNKKSNNHKIICNFYLKGDCKFGNKCKYSHDNKMSKADLPCQFYLKNKCTFGDKCKYQHID